MLKFDVAKGMSKQWYSIPESYEDIDCLFPIFELEDVAFYISIGSEQNNNIFM